MADDGSRTDSDVLAASGSPADRGLASSDDDGHDFGDRRIRGDRRVHEEHRGREGREDLGDLEDLEGPGNHQDHENHGGHGSASSWLAVTVVVLGFAIGGVGLCAGPDWFLFCMGAAVCVMGGILLLVFRVFRDVVLDHPRSPFDPDDPDGT
ncbi:HGxxPAAW family protein [Streptosporangium carneum]|uniref:Uncharacterized protein n=1 Tax=Streptosporangium carneum TaxID=47481 RepID=A0A9W6HYW8_9ACTN|nr:HGxxPAAW family protein [Streptosporangium carneum]GLK08346.1 hypothetical protein GCM10017600_17510 [Streptosporangium carneum]